MTVEPPAGVPNYQSASDLPARLAQLPVFIECERKRVAVPRHSWNARFAPRVKEQIDYSCAVCAVQLEIVEAAHIIPVNDPRSSDEVWNGLSLCPSHHTLFDARRFIVEPNLEIAVDDDTVTFLQDSGRASGIELLTNFRGQRIRAPQFWQRSHELQERMRDALAYNRSLTGIPRSSVKTE